MHHTTDRIAHTTAFVTPVVVHWLEQEIAQWVHPMKDRSVVGTEACTLFRVYIGGHTCIFLNCVSLLLTPVGRNILYELQQVCVITNLYGEMCMLFNHNLL